MPLLETVIMFCGAHRNIAIFTVSLVLTLKTSTHEVSTPAVFCVIL